MLRRLSEAEDRTVCREQHLLEKTRIPQLAREDRAEKVQSALLVLPKMYCSS